LGHTGFVYTSEQARLLALAERHGYGIYLGMRNDEARFSAPEHGVLVLGPPRCGKTSAIVVPNVLASCGSVVSTSTKPDVLQITSLPRSYMGECLLFDPSGTVECPPWVRRIAWSPLGPATSWDGAVRVADAMVRAARPGTDRGEGAHWSERAGALLAAAFHAGAVDKMPFPDVMQAIDRREVGRFQRPLAKENLSLPQSALASVLATEAREQSGIWSTASGVLAGYRTEKALASSHGDVLDAARFVRETSTLYICAGSDSQRLAGSLVAGVITQLRSEAYEMNRDAVTAGRRGYGPPMLLALDEVANIAPLHDLPNMVAEGGSQGVVTLACFQDLSQARARWGNEADGFLSTFQSKLVFPGIGDTRSLEMISVLVGELDLKHSSTTTSPAWTALLGQRPLASTTESTRRLRRLPVDEIARGHKGNVLHLDGTTPTTLGARPWYEDRDLRAIVGAERFAERVSERGRPAISR